MQSTQRLKAIVLSAMVGSALMSGCSSGYSTTQPVDEIVSAEDKALATTGMSLVRQGSAQILRATGAITAGVTQYRTLLGPLNLNTPGEVATGGRREINWDGVPAALTNVDTFPVGFFNVNSPRGVIYSTPGTGFRVANDGFLSVNAGFAGEFNAFSPAKIFASVGSATMDIKFVVAGSNTPAVVTGFGSVFDDVGRSGKTTIQFYDVLDKLLLVVTAPVKSDTLGLSFVGAVFDSPVVARVRITAGESPLSATAVDLARGVGKPDLVAMDDFIYGEPRAIK